MTRVAVMLVAAGVVACVASASARDLGVRGATWAIAEPDLLAQIEARLLEMERSGELARLETQARVTARAKLEEPDPASGIAPAREERSRLWDPAITVARDIRAADGALIAAAGTRVNPLERVALVRDLLFVDGRREAEIAWALAHEPREDRAARRTAARADAAIPPALLLRPGRPPRGAVRHRVSTPSLVSAGR